MTDHTTRSDPGRAGPAGVRGGTGATLRLMPYAGECLAQDRWHLWAVWERDLAEGHCCLTAMPFSLFLYDSVPIQTADPPLDPRANAANEILCTGSLRERLTRVGKIPAGFSQPDTVWAHIPESGAAG